MIRMLLLGIASRASSRLSYLGPVAHLLATDPPPASIW